MISPSLPLENHPRISIHSLALLLLIFAQTLLFSPTVSFSEDPKMRVHPLLRKQYTTTIRFTSDLTTREPGKKLRRLPHVFSRVLELPFRSDADVMVMENRDCFKFVAETDDLCREVRADMVELHPGVTKIVVRSINASSFGVSLVDELELDVWRFRLPDTTRPELVSVACEDGELIVTVPKGGEVGTDDDEGGVRFVLIQ